MMNVSKIMAGSGVSVQDPPFDEDESLLYTYAVTNQGRLRSVILQRGVELRVFLLALRVVTAVKLYKPPKTQAKEERRILYNSTNQWPPAKVPNSTLSTRLFRQMATVCNRKCEHHLESI